MGTVLSWAKREIELAKNEESPDIEEYDKRKVNKLGEIK